MTLTSRIPPSPTLFPYTTLFRSRLFREAFRFRARFLQTNDGRISRFLRCDIFARALAKFLARLGDVENIVEDRKSTRLNSSHVETSYAVFCLKKKKSTRAIIIQQ